MDGAGAKKTLAFIIVFISFFWFLFFIVFGWFLLVFVGVSWYLMGIVFIGCCTILLDEQLVKVKKNAENV